MAPTVVIVVMSRKGRKKEIKGEIEKEKSEGRREVAD